MEMQRIPVEVFYSCSDSPTDAPLLEQLDRHLRALQREGLLTTWHKRRIVPGNDWQRELDHHLNTASLILLLVSSDFLASDYCYGIEMQRALQRHEANEARVIPLLLRPVDWQQTPFGKLKVLPSNEKPVTAWYNRDEAFTNIVQGIKMALERGQFLPSFSRSSGVWNIPYRRNPHFTGRDDLLDRLVQQFAPETLEQGITIRRAALTQPQAIRGLGGIGKTQIAVEYAYRSRDLGWYRHTLWVNAASEEALLISFTELAELLPNFSAKAETDQQKLVEAIKHWFEECQERWLLIFDNADDIPLVRAYLPQQGNGSILLTTRAHAVGSLATPLEVETMGWLEGVQLLLRRAQRFEHASDELINCAGDIVVALDHFPLALDQAGAFLEETGCSFADYLDLYQSHRRQLLAERGKQATDYPHSVATTWSLSLQKVHQANPAAAELLELCSFLAPDRIPEELLRDGAAFWSPALQQAVADPLLWQRLIADLLKYSLVKRLVEEHLLSIHRLVQAVQRDRMEGKVQRQYAERVIRAIHVVFPKNPQDLISWPQCLRYLDQAQICYTWIEHYGFVSAESAEVLNRAGLYLWRHALYSLAKPLYQRALTIREQVLGTDHSDTATSLNNLAHLYQEQGKYPDAELLYQRALATREQILGVNHPVTAQSLNNLAELYRAQGKYMEAEPLHKRALAIREQALGAKHPDTAQSLNNLALLYQSQGKYAEAEPLHKRALAIREQVLGINHPNTAKDLSNLAELYQAQGKYMEAEPLYQRALTIQEEALGANHPDTAQGLNNLAILYQRQSKYAEAEPLHKRALAIREQMLGANHPTTAMDLNNLAILYQAQGRYAEAEPLQNRALAIREQMLSANHPALATSLNNLAILYQRQSKYAEAEPLHKRALAIREETLGANHPATATSLNNLAELYRAQGTYAEAEPLYQRALTIREQVLGANHPDTAQSLNNLAVLYKAQEKYAEAESLYQRALAIREQVLGANHPDTAQSLNNLAHLYQEQGKYREGKPLLIRSLAIAEQVLGVEHPTTRIIRANYTALLEAMKEDESASL
ncbi:MAG TPA: FxSxx-COOH system tetratricopeptide repeat protein [Ktedonobacteraceae bacterium]|nr:FxSxx-COOH system tetratricopeptide repeat protein [Ktedonobacteraceae bacterium]